MKLKVVVTHEVSVATDTLCASDCAYSDMDYPEGYCDLFSGRRERSESEGVTNYRRLPRCIQEAGK